MSNVIAGRIATPAHSLGGRWVRAFGAGREFGGVLGVVLIALDAELASAVAWLAAIHAKAAGVVFFRAGSDVRAGHETNKNGFS
jgi:hypothetical protein